MENPFAKYEPGVTPSLNRVRAAVLPGPEWPDSLLGLLGYHLLAAAVLRRRVASAFGWDADHPDLLYRFDRAFDDPDKIRVANVIAEEYGRSLALVLLTLKQGQPANRAARPEWRDVHWRWWAQRRRVFVGGGLVAGRLGETAVTTAAKLVSRYADLDVVRAAQPASLPLLGVARLAPASANAMSVFDFGQTSVKQARAWYADGVLKGLTDLHSVPAACDDALAPLEDLALVPAQANAQAAFIVAQLAAGVALDDTAVAASIACYLYDGRPVPGYMTCYGRLQMLNPNIHTLLQERLQARLGRSITLHLVHDGAAAALAYAGEPDAAVVTLGTAVGIGFPRGEGGLRPLHSKF